MRWGKPGHRPHLTSELVMDMRLQTLIATMMLLLMVMVLVMIPDDDSDDDSSAADADDGLMLAEIGREVSRCLP